MTTPKALEELLKNLREYLLDIGKQGRLVNLEYYQIDEMVAKIIKAGQQAMLERVEEDVIGEDEERQPGDEISQSIIRNHKNQVRIGQRQALSKLKQEVG